MSSVCIDKRSRQMKDYSITEDLMDGITTDLETAYDYGYDQGYGDGMKASCDCKGNMESEYNRGLNDAWEAARKLAVSSKEGGLDTETIVKIFDGLTYYAVFEAVSASEAVAKIKEYEQQKQDPEIKVGDEVVIDDSIGIVTRAFSGAVTCYVMRKDGSSGEEDRNDCKTTGRHFDQIAEVLTEMRGESE